MADREEPGLLGNLPRRRPAVESPRRAEARAAAARSDDADHTEALTEAEEDGGSGLEQLARAGAGTAFGVAAAGLRLAGRAAGEVGKAVGRR